MADIPTVYDELCSLLLARKLPPAALWWEQDPGALRREMLQYGDTKERAAGNAHAVELDNWLPLLTEVERTRLELYKKKWLARTGREATADPNACFMVSQNPESHWTAARCRDGALPTKLHSSGARLFSPKCGRWMTTNECGTQFGPPCRSDCALALNLPLLDLSRVDRAHELLGNAQHMPNIAVAWLAILASVSLPEASSRVSVNELSGWVLPCFLKVDKRGYGL